MCVVKNMGALASTLLAIAAVLVAIGFMISVVNRLIGDNRREVLRARVTDFWFRTASLEAHEQFQAAVRSRYQNMRSLRVTFIKVFLIISALLFCDSVYNALTTDFADQLKTRQEIVKTDFNFRRSVLYGSVYVEKSVATEEEIDVFAESKPFDDDGTSCIPGEGAKALAGLAHLYRVEGNVVKFLEENENDEWRTRLTSIGSDFITLAVFGLILSISLFLSFNLTLWLLSKFTGSKLRTFLIVMADLLIAVLLPPFLYSLTIMAFVYTIISFHGGVVDYSTFENPTWTTLIISEASIALTLQFVRPVVVALMTTQFPWEVQWIFLPAVFEAAAGNAFQYLQTFIADTMRVVKFDFDVGVIESQVNYAIFVDLLFSLTYLVPCLALVGMQRSKLLREILLNAVQWVGDHPKGPLGAASDIFTSIIKFIRDLVK